MVRRKIIAVGLAAVLMLIVCLGNAGQATALEIDCGKLTKQTVITVKVKVGQTPSVEKVTIDTKRTALGSMSVLPRTTANAEDITYRQKLPEAIRELIERIAQEFNLDPKLAVAVAEVESGGNLWAVSPAGAIGVMQLMPGTARMLGVNPFMLEDNIRGGCRYLKDLLARYKNPVLALAAYNAGPGAVDAYRGVPPYRETQDYVRKVLARLRQ